MPRMTAIKAIDEAKELGAEWVSLSGGEPFLEPELLIDLVDYAHQKGLKAEAVTNGFWGDDDGILNTLIESGLDVLNLSIDDYHAEFIALDVVTKAYQGAVDQGLRVVFMISTGANSEITSESLPRLLGDPNIQVVGEPRINEPNAVLFQTQHTPIGRGKELKYEPTQITSIKCTEVLRDIGVKPNGDVLPCCGALGTIESLGNINEESLGPILERAHKNPKYRKIIKGFNVEGRYSSKCHACVEN